MSRVARWYLHEFVRLCGLYSISVNRFKSGEQWGISPGSAEESQDSSSRTPRLYDVPQIVRHYMLQNLSRLKPGGQRTTHLLLAASLWTGIGLLLTARGLHWLAKSDSFLLLVPAVFAGLLKSRYILDKTAAKSIERILHLEDGTCLGAVYSKKTWGLVVIMMGGGIVLRMTSCPLPVLGFLYVVVGCALIRSSRLGWKARNM